MAKLLLIHGPNLNLLGKREPGLYGTTSLEDINQKLMDVAKNLGHDLEVFQSNAEHEIVDRIQQCPSRGIEFIIINPAALTHTSVSLRDALLSVSLPFIEVHLSNIYARESFRRHSYLSDIAVGNLCGFGAMSYELALIAANDYLKRNHHGHS